MTELTVTTATVPTFAAAAPTATPDTVEERQIIVPPNRRTPFQENFTEIIKPLLDHLKIQFKYDSHKFTIRLRPGPQSEVTALQKVRLYQSLYLKTTLFRL